MSIEIRFTEEDAKRVRNRHGDAVADRLESLVEQKNETLQWKSTIEGAKQRFYTVVENNGACFPEMFFNADRCEYRAILAWVPKFELFAFMCVIQKNDHYQTSKQHAVLEQVYQHPHRMIAEIEQDLTDTMTS